jgi:hypothetical protein
VGLIDDDRVSALGQGGHLVHHEGELLEGGHHDLALRRPQGLREFFRRLEHARDQAVDVLELIDRSLELAVEDHAIGHDHDLVEDLPVLGVVEGGQPVSGPADREGLPRAGGVLDQVVTTSAVLPGPGLQPPDRVPLVEPGEDG